MERHAFLGRRVMRGVIPILAAGAPSSAGKAGTKELEEFLIPPRGKAHRNVPAFLIKPAPDEGRYPFSAGTPSSVFGMFTIEKSVFCII